MNTTPTPAVAVAHASAATTPPTTVPTTNTPTLPEGALLVDALDMEAQGIARRPDGKVVFIDGALPTEIVSARVHRRKNNWEAGTLTHIHRESAQRVRAGCPHFGLHEGACGGCKMQHLHIGAQVAVKQRVLEDNLWHLGKVRAQTIARPIEGPAWGYRFRARLSVRYVIKKGEVLIGFHERKSRYIADMRRCPILPPHVDAMLLPLRALIMSMDARESCPQIEVACGDHTTALVLRHLEPLSAADIERLRSFARTHAVQWWLQPKGPDTVHLLETDERVARDAANLGKNPQMTCPGSGAAMLASAALLSYSLPEFGITMPFRPTDFTQVNPYINRVMVQRALRLLDAQPSERVIDWFCGLGNFTLPIATCAGQVVGIEGSTALVERSRSNWAANDAARRAQGQPPLAHTDFIARNLFEMTPSVLMADGVAARWLIDPPREGAFALCKALGDIHQAQIQAEGSDPTIAAQAQRLGWQRPQRIVYVSCNPATLARDAGLLVHQAGYRCTSAGVINMFSHTAHVESMAVFERVN